MYWPFSAIERAVSPHEAYDAVKAAFVAHARGEWTMQPKLYVTNYPAGDFRAMPALGGGSELALEAGQKDFDSVERLKRVVRENPQQVAMVLKGWIKER